MTDTENTGDDVREAAQDYLASLNNDVDESRKNELRDDIEDGEERYERLAQEHGEEHKLVKKAKSVLESRREELRELEEVEEQLGTAREDLLQKVADEFELSERWLQSEAIEAVTHALYGRRDQSYKLFGEEIQNEDVLSDFDDFEQIELAAVVALLAKDALGQTEKVREQYQRLEDSKSFAVFKVLCGNGSMTSQEVAEQLDEDKGTANNWLKSPLNFWDRLIPFYRPKKGAYGLSTTGQYFYKHYFDGEIETTEVDTQDEDEVEDETEDDSGETQATLGATAEAPSESEDEKNRAENSEESDISEIEDTEEKADAMFSKISDQSEN
jgi:hypothetical protein